jgi:hypothetical protein
VEQYELLKIIANCFDSLKIPYFVTGAIASIAYGEARLTNDIDVVADIGERHISGLKKWFPVPDFYISEEAVREAIYHRDQFNIIHAASGLKVDVIMPKRTPFDKSRFKRIKRMRISEETEANFSSPEDVIIKKMDFYRKGGSEKHLRDITGILKISGDTLDISYIGEWANRLGLDDIWKALHRRARKK